MYQLTQKEMEIMNLVTSGLNNQEIAEKLRISTNTTNAYVSSIYKKLDLKNKINMQKKY